MSIHGTVVRNVFERAGWQIALKTALADSPNICQCGWRGSCLHGYDDERTVPSVWSGRCKSGSRWFWTLRWYTVDDTGSYVIHHIDGRSDTELGSVGEMAAAYSRFDKARLGALSARTASDRLKEINSASRAERIAAKPLSPDTDPDRVEYLHSLDWDEPYDDAFAKGSWVRREYRITRKTAARVYYVKDYRGGEGFADRAALERDGQVRLRYEYVGQSHRTLHVEPPPIPTRQNPANLSELRKQMADAHPDRGGDREAFEAARASYLRAKRWSA